MTHLVWLVPVALGMGLVGLAAFLWSLRARQYEDLDGASERVLLQNGEDVPLPDERLGRNPTQDRVSKMDGSERRHS